MKTEVSAGSLQHLQLAFRGCGIGEAGARALAARLPQQLRSLYLSMRGCPVGAGGATGHISDVSRDEQPRIGRVYTSSIFDIHHTHAHIITQKDYLSRCRLSMRLRRLRCDFSSSNLCEVRKHLLSISQSSSENCVWTSGTAAYPSLAFAHLQSACLLVCNNCDFSWVVVI